MMKAIDEINYITTSFNKLSHGQEMSITKETLDSCCRQLFSGKNIDFESALSDCLRSGLMKEKNGKIAITRLGKHFAGLNPEFLFEANERQIKLLKGNLHQTILAKEIALAIKNKKKQMPKTKLLTELGLLEGNVGKNEIDKEFLRRASAFAVGTITEEELKEQLIEKSHYGKIAEDFVVKWEVERLGKNKMHKESKNVRRVGHLDVMLGYDIESFTKSGEVPDRLIEVKCTRGDSLRFYWSAHEIKVAKEKKDNYFIYFVWLDNEGNPLDLELFQNPAKKILASSRFVVWPGKFVVMEK